MEEDVWARVRADYLAGMSGPRCAARHGVSLSTLRARARRGGWRRADAAEGARTAQPFGPSALAALARDAAANAARDGDPAKALVWLKLATAAAPLEELDDEYEDPIAEIDRRIARIIAARGEEALDEEEEV